MALADLELSVLNRVALNSERSPSFCLPSSEIAGVPPSAWSDVFVVVAFVSADGQVTEVLAKISFYLNALGLRWSVRSILWTFLVDTV